MTLNPRDDVAFVELAMALLEDGDRAPAAFQKRLSARYPAVVVRARGLSGEPETWYVFRDGHWVGDHAQ